MVATLRLASLSLAAAAHLAHGLSVTITDSSSLKSVASSIAYGTMKYYHGNETGGTPGTLPEPYYWWEAGEVFGAMVQYWYNTGDTTYNNVTIEAIQWQASTGESFLPSNQSLVEGNDDQVFWAFTALDAAELAFPNPSSDYPSYITMAESVFNQQVGRWDSQTCGGGLRWQIYSFNSGYDYRNTVANGGFRQLAARLARYTGNSTYVDWAEKSWDWFTSSVLFVPDTYQINDGTDDSANCTVPNTQQFSYNYGIYINALAYMYNYTQDDKWMTPLEGILNRTLEIYFPASMGNKIMVEAACQPYGTCDTDQLTYKGLMMRWFATTAQLVPSLADTLWPYVQASGAGAAGQCDGGTDGMTCGQEWNTTSWDGTYGVGQQFSALQAVQSNLVLTENLHAPYTSSNGGNSQSGDLPSSTPSNADHVKKITTADRAGAGILTALCILGSSAGAYFLVKE